MLGQDSSPELNVPSQDLNELSFSDTSPSGLNKWAKNLPMANVGETARQLYQAITELNQLAISAAQRIELLEIVRTPLHYVCKELAKHFLNQPIILPEKQQKVANLSLALRKNLATGYKIIVIDLIDDAENEKTRKQLAMAIHRTLAEFGQILLRSCQLYSASPADLWREMHTIYRMAESHDLLGYEVSDSDDSDTRIDSAYKRCLLLSCCRPNQLRQSELEVAYALFKDWAEFVEVGADYSNNSIFVINMELDQPPRYRSLLHDTLIDHYYGLDTAELVSRLTEHLTVSRGSQGSNSLLPVSTGANEQLIHHMHQAFGILTKRTFKRLDSQGKLGVCFGLSAVHYHISGQVDFHNQMMRATNTLADGDENIFMTQSSRSNDAWSEAFDARSGGSQSAPPGALIAFNVHMDEDASTRYPDFTVNLINTSPGGYCIRWQGEMPTNIQAGEIMAVRETNQQPWSIAVIRWIRKAKQQGTHIGIELLAPNAMPCGIQLLQKTGAPSEYMRGIILPEISAIGQPRTIITPKVPFQSGQKVSIKNHEAESKFSLQKRITATASFSQFELKENNFIEESAGKEPKTPKNEDEDFDSLWNSL